MFQLPLPSQLFRLAIRNPAFDLFLRLPSDRNSPDTVNPYIIHLLVTKNYKGRSPLWGYAAKFTPIDDAQSTTDPRLPVREGRAERAQWPPPSQSSRAANRNPASDQIHREPSDRNSLVPLARVPVCTASPNRLLLSPPYSEAILMCGKLTSKPRFLIYFHAFPKSGITYPSFL